MSKQKDLLFVLAHPAATGTPENPAWISCLVSGQFLFIVKVKNPGWYHQEAGSPRQPSAWWLSAIIRYSQGIFLSPGGYTGCSGEWRSWQGLTQPLLFWNFLCGYHTRHSDLCNSPQCGDLWSWGQGGSSERDLSPVALWGSTVGFDVGGGSHPRKTQLNRIRAFRFLGK